MAQVIRAHPEWTLEQLFRHFDGPRGTVVEALTLHELCEGTRLGPVVMPLDGGPPIDQVRLEQAKRLEGEEFLTCLREVLSKAPGPVGAAYLRARVGGPRWKIQKALKELIDKEVVVRTGVTSSTRYKLESGYERPRRRRGTKASHGATRTR